MPPLADRHQIEQVLLNLAINACDAMDNRGTLSVAVEPVELAVTPPVRKIDMATPEPVNLLDTAGKPIARRVGPILALVAIGWLLRVLIRRRRK